jgi:hypothetical protein
LLKGKSIEPFYQALRSKYTREAYERRLVTFLEYVEMDVDGFVAKSREDVGWAQKVITDYLMREKDRSERKEIAPSTIANVRKPVRLLLEMNDVTQVNWRKMTRMLPPVRRYALDRAPTSEELILLTSNSETRFQAIILTMASSGIRIGSWDYLNWGHVEPIRRNEKVVAAKLLVYAGEPEEYYSFITPEAYNKLKQYIDLREEHGEIISKNSPLIRDKWLANNRGSRKGDIRAPKRLQHSGVKRLFENMLWKFGIRKEKKRRHEFSIHSIRKFFKTRCEQVMKPINVETLMGHSTGISDSYYRPTEKDLLEDYLNAVSLLTISEAEQIRQESQMSREQTDQRIGQLEELVSKLIAERGQTNPSHDQNHNKNTSNGTTPKKIVKTKEIEHLINLGWEPMFNLPDGRTVMKQFQPRT